MNVWTEFEVNAISGYLSKTVLANLTLVTLTFTSVTQNQLGSSATQNEYVDRL